MKKLCSLGLAILLALPFAACQSKALLAPLAPEEFQTRMAAAGYTISDVSDQFPQGYVDAALLAFNDDYQIEFYLLPSMDLAIAAYRDNHDLFEKGKGSASAHASVDTEQYSTYKLTAGGVYYLISRIENTFIYVVAAEEYRASVDEAIEILGY